MELGCGLTSVRGNRGKNYKNEPLAPLKHTKKKKFFNPSEAELEKNKIVSEFACSEDSASLYKIKIGRLQAKNVEIAFAVVLNYFAGDVLADGCTH
jgi:hypothetical protein